MRRKSGRYNTTDTTTANREFRWPNEGYTAPAQSKRPSYDDLTSAQWRTGQLSNILQVNDIDLMKDMLTQVTLAVRDAVASS